VDALVRVLRIAGDGDAHAPVQVTRDRTGTHVVEQAPREVAGVRGTALPAVYPGLQRLREGGQVEEEVVRLPELGRRAVDLRARIDQVGRVELVAAVVALVAAGLPVPADRARSLDVPVGERVPGRRRERDELRALDDRALLVQRPEEILRDEHGVRGPPAP